jgi:hypothetical protein
MVPVYFIVSIMIVASLWNLWADLNWSPSLIVLVFIPVPTLALCACYSNIWPNPFIGQCTFYCALWMFYPVFGTRLSYLAVTLDMPLRDNLFQSWDRAIGFDWLAWTRFVYSHPYMKYLQVAAYASYAVQPFVTVAILSKWAPKRRNAEFLTSILIALIITIAVWAMMPALSPGRWYGYPSSWRPIIIGLRSGSHAAYPYTGIITFPSFHAVMAILFTAANRGMKYGFIPFLALNALMLLSIPAIGQHYLVDIIAAIPVAAAAYFSASRLVRTGMT